MNWPWNQPFIPTEISLDLEPEASSVILTGFFGFRAQQRERTADITLIQLFSCP